MSHDPQLTEKLNETSEPKKGVFGVIMHSFFVVPFLLAVLSVLLFASVRILTMEKHSAYDYLNTIRKGGAEKRWQAAFELSRILVNQKEIPQDQKFIDEMIMAYEASKHDDERVKQYLIMAMGRSSRQEFVDVLIKNISEEKNENLYAIISALGILQSEKSIEVLLKYLKDENPRIRLASVIALSHLGSIKTIEPLKQMLNDSEPNVVWDAAIALARMDDKSGKQIILNLLNRDYFTNFPNVNNSNVTKVIQVAINATHHWDDEDINKSLAYLFSNDPNMNVRKLARQQLDAQK